MEDSKDKEFINISNKKFKNEEYINPEHTNLAYKPGEAFWCSLKSSTPGFLSEYDHLYGEFQKPDDNGILYITTVKLKEDTAIISPCQCETIMKGFTIFTDDNNDIGLSNHEKRCLFLEYLKDKPELGISQHIKNIICQIDTPEDIDALERSFGNYHIGKQNSDEVYEKLYKNVIKGIKQCFAGIEVTDYLLGRDPLCDSELWEVDQFKKSKDPKYHGDFGTWDMHSLALFDTKCINVIKEEEINKKEHESKVKKLRKENDELEY